MNLVNSLRSFFGMDAAVEDGLFGQLGNAVNSSGKQTGKGKYGLSHPDGTPCDAKKPESCPEMRRQIVENGGDGKRDVSSQQKSIKVDTKVDGVGTVRCNGQNEADAAAELSRLAIGGDKKALEGLKKAAKEASFNPITFHQEDDSSCKELWDKVPNRGDNDDDSRSDVPFGGPGSGWEYKPGVGLVPHSTQKQPNWLTPVKPSRHDEQETVYRFDTSDANDPTKEIDEEETQFARQQFFDNAPVGTKVTMGYGRTAIKNEDGSWTVSTRRRQDGYQAPVHEYDDGGSTSDVVTHRSKKTSADIARYSNCKVNGKHIDNVVPKVYRKRKFSDKLLGDREEHQLLR